MNTNTYTLLADDLLKCKPTGGVAMGRLTVHRKFYTNNRDVPRHVSKYKATIFNVSDLSLNLSQFSGAFLIFPRNLKNDYKRKKKIFFFIYSVIKSHYNNMI